MLFQCYQLFLQGEEDADFLRHYNPYDYSGGAGPQEEGERSIEPGKGDFKVL